MHNELEVNFQSCTMAVMSNTYVTGLFSITEIPLLRGDCSAEKLRGSGLEFVSILSINAFLPQTALHGWAYWKYCHVYVQRCLCKENRDKLVCVHRFVQRLLREKTEKLVCSEISLQRPGEMDFSAWTFIISDKISQDTLCQGRCCRTYNLAKDPSTERRTKARSIRTTSLLKHRCHW